jgi:iron complex outermembrane receptor protein
MFAGSRSFLTIALFLFAIPALAQPTASPAPSAEAPPTAEPATGEPLAAKPTMAEPKPAESVPAQPSPVPAIKAEQDLVLDEVVVSAARIGVPVKENPSAASVVTEKDLDILPRSIGAEEALRLVPGVKVDNQADGERVHISIRGQGLLTERGVRGIKVLLDGIPLNDPSGFAPDLFDVDWSNVQRIEVIRGPASALYGSGSAGGVINITTKDGGRGLISGEGFLTTGTHNFWKEQAAAGGTDGTWNYQASASRTYGDGYRDHTRFDAMNLYGKVQWNPLPALRLKAIVAGTTFFNENAEGLNLAQLQQDPRQANPDAGKYNEYQRTRRLTLGLVGQYQLGAHQDIDFSVYQRGTRWKESVPSSLQDRDYYSPGAAAQYNLHLGNNHLRNHFSAGADIDLQWISDKRHPNLGAGVAGPDLQSDQKIAQNGLGVFALDRIEIGRAFGVFLGIRHDRVHNQLTDNLQANGVDLSGSANFSKTTARAGASWNPRPSIGVYANWSQGFLPPATEELANNPDAMGGFNAHLVPATSMGQEVGVRGVLSKQFSYDLTLFHLSTDNDFGRYRITSRPLETFYQNAGSSRRYGVEAALAWYPTDALSFEGAYTYSNFKYTNIKSLFGDFSSTFMPNAPQHQASANAQYLLARHWVLGAGADLVSHWYVDQSNQTTADGYALLHVRAAYRWQVPGYAGEIFAVGRNILGKQYVAFTEPDPDGNSYQPGPTREVFVGARVKFGP